MKTLIAATLIVAASNANAIGFSPWGDFTNASNAPAPAAVSIERTGFGPWRDRPIVDEISIRPQTEVIFSTRDLSVFRPWS